MIAFIKNRSDRAWLILLLATATTFGISDSRSIGLYAGIAPLVIAYIKGRLVVLDFMELRHAPSLWRGLFEAWLLLVSAALLAVYLVG